MPSLARLRLWTLLRRLPGGQQLLRERYSEVIGKVNETLDKVDWHQMGRSAKSPGSSSSAVFRS